MRLAYAFALAVAGGGFVLALTGCQAPVPYGDYYLPEGAGDGVERKQFGLTTGDGPNGAHIMFLNFDGAMLSRPTSFRDNSALNQSQIAQGATNFPAFNATPYAPALTRQAAVDKITQTYLDFFKAYNVQVVNTRPSSGRYTMCMVGGKPSAVGIGGGAAGVAPLDCDNDNEADVVYAFSEVLTPQNTGSANGSLKAIAVTCAQEVAHAFGLGHTTNNKDIMYPQLTGSTVGFAGPSQLYSDGSGRCSGQGATQQDSAGMLTDVLGSGTGTGPGPMPDPECTTNTDCATGQVCENQMCVDAPKPTCAEPCAAGETCQPDGTCKPDEEMPGEMEPGGVGATCVTNAECAGGVCTDFGNGKVCTNTCVVSDASTCPANSACVTTGAGKAYCKPMGNPGRGTGGCSTVTVANRSSDGMLATCLILIAAVVLRHRRWLFSSLRR